MAGSSVSEVAIVNSTAMLDAMPTPLRMLTPRASMPSSAMQTTEPAKNTARPEVLTAVTTAVSTSRPARSPWRKRVTMNSA